MYLITFLNIMVPLKVLRLYVLTKVPERVNIYARLRGMVSGDVCIKGWFEKGKS